MSAPRLSPDTKQKILDAYLDGEKIAVIALMYGIDESYPRILHRRHRDRDSTFYDPKEKRIDRRNPQNSEPA